MKTYCKSCEKLVELVANANMAEPRFKCSACGGSDFMAKRKCGLGAVSINSETRKRVARLGGLAVSKDKEHMSRIGKMGGAKVSACKEYMAFIGKKGGEATKKKPGHLAKIGRPYKFKMKAKNGSADNE